MHLHHYLLIANYDYFCLILLEKHYFCYMGLACFVKIYTLTNFQMLSSVLTG